jgi:hypothetical protein
MTASRHRKKGVDWVKVIATVLFVAIVAVCVAVPIWVHAAAPCSWLDWLPAKDVPARCLTIGVR